MTLNELKKNKTFRIIAILVAALLLLLAVWAVFFKKGSSGTYAPTEAEARLSILLNEIEGVQKTTVMITERDGLPVSAVVVFEGEDGILIRSRLIEASAKALSLNARDILVYPANH